MLVSYYLPGNRSAHPPEHLVHGSTGHTVDEQTHFDASRMPVCGWMSIVNCTVYSRMAGARVDEQGEAYNEL